MVNDLNSKIQFSEEKIRFIPKIHRSKTKKVSKISIRTTSPICSYVSLEKQLKDNPNYIPKHRAKYRETYLSQRLGENYKEFDIKSSVPRTAHAMLLYGNKPSPSANLGDLKEDIYKVLFEQFLGDFQQYFNSSVQTWEEARPFFKSIFMSLFFGGSVGMIRNSFISSEDEFIEELKKDGNILPIEEELRLRKFRHLHYTLKVLDSLIAKWKKSVDDYCGVRKIKDTEVFFQESAIYLEVRKILMDRGIDTIQVYDAFYFANELPSDIEEIFHQAFRNFLNQTNLHASYYAYVASKKQ